MCPWVQGLLAALLDEFWVRCIIRGECCSAYGMHIPKEEHSESIGQFRPTTLLNVEGNIFFSILSRRCNDMTRRRDKEARPRTTTFIQS